MLRNSLQKTTSKIWYSKEQARLLESAFRKNPFLTEKRLASLTKTTGANKEHVKAWFRNEHKVPEPKTNGVLQQVAKLETYEASRYGNNPFQSSNHFSSVTASETTRRPFSTIISSVTASSSETTRRHFNPAERYILKKCYSINEKPTCDDMMILAELFKTTSNRIKNWFNNERAKKLNAEISPVICIEKIPTELGWKKYGKAVQKKKSDDMATFRPRRASIKNDHTLLLHLASLK